MHEKSTMDRGGALLCTSGVLIDAALIWHWRRSIWAFEVRLELASFEWLWRRSNALESFDLDLELFAVLQPFERHWRRSIWASSVQFKLSMSVETPIEHRFLK